MAAKLRRATKRGFHHEADVAAPSNGPNAQIEEMRHGCSRVAGIQPPSPYGAVDCAWYLIVNEVRSNKFDYAAHVLTNEAFCLGGELFILVTNVDLREH